MGWPADSSPCQRGAEFGWSRLAPLAVTTNAVSPLEPCDQGQARIASRLPSTPFSPANRAMGMAGRMELGARRVTSNR